MDSREFAELIEALETRQRKPECFSDEELVALASGHLSGEALHKNQTHITGCFICLQAYASLRGLMEVSVAPYRPESDVQTVKPGLIAWLTSVVSAIRRFLAI